jgi:hypothetical protein
MTSYEDQEPSALSAEERDDIIRRLEAVLSDDSEPHDHWIEVLATIASGKAMPIGELRSIATQVTWISRRLGHPIMEPSEYCSNEGITGLLHLYSCGQRLRYDFNFTGLATFVANHKASPNMTDALVQSFDAFAQLGARTPGAITQLQHTLSLSDLDTRARHVCLAGIWSAHTIPEQATLLLDLANQMIELGEADGNVYFRRSSAYRLLNRFTEALDDIDYAFTLLPPGNNEIHQDYLRERQLIGVAIQSYNYYRDNS